MIRVNEITDAAAARAYYKAKNADYYVEGQEQVAYWHGQAAERLGLSGQVGMDDFHALCDNLHPRTHTPLTNARGPRRVGYDFTFSVPKSVSVASTLGGDERIADAFREAVGDTMAEVERDMATRVRKGYRDEDRRTGNMVWCDFLHTTSRPIKGQPDPQLHIHAVAFNLTWDGQEREWKAGQFGRLKADAPYYQAVFRTRLSDRLQGIGYRVTATRDDFEVTGIPERVNHEFSRRTHQIERLAKALGITKPDTKAKLGATSRERKAKGLTWDDLLGLWDKRLTPEERLAVHDTVKNATVPVLGKDATPEAVQFALDHLLERDSTVDQRRVMTEALRFGLGSVSPESVIMELGRRRDLIRREVEGRTVVTTKGVLGEEKKLLAFAVQGRGRFRPLSPNSASVLHNSLHKQGDLPSASDLVTLSPSQQAAVEHVWTSPDRLILTRGAAGTGKTTLTKAALAGVKVPWVILAPSAEASRGVLRRDGFDQADTLAAFLNAADMQQRVKNGLIWVDEASLVGAHDASQLIKLADSLNARVVFSGDRRQHKSVSRGDILALLEDRAKLPVAEVGEIKRQAGEYRQAVERLAAGKMQSAFSKLDAMGWMKQTDHVPHIGKMVAAEYLAALETARPDQKPWERVAVVAPTHAVGREVTDAIRQSLRTAGKIGPEDREFDVLVNLNLTKAQLERAKEEKAEGVHVGRYAAYRHDRLSLAEGDTIRMTANAKDVTKTHRLNNGAVYQVDGFTPAGDIRLNNGWVLPQNAGVFTHGYATTTFAAQGRTVDRVLIAMPAASFPAVGKEAAYVAVSRGRQQATVFTDSKDELREAWEREDKRLTATELVRRPVKNVRKKLARHLSWLRDAVNRSKALFSNANEVDHERQQELSVRQGRQ